MRICKVDSLRSLSQQKKWSAVLSAGFDMKFICAFIYMRDLLLLCRSFVTASLLFWLVGSIIDDRHRFGDLRAETVRQEMHVSRSTFNTLFDVRSDALEPQAMTILLEAPRFVALNTCMGQTKPTQLNQSSNGQDGRSQIGFILTKQATAQTRRSQTTPFQQMAAAYKTPQF